MQVIFGSTLSSNQTATIHHPRYALAVHHFIQRNKNDTDRVPNQTARQQSRRPQLRLLSLGFPGVSVPGSEPRHLSLSLLTFTCRITTASRTSQSVTTKIRRDEMAGLCAVTHSTAKLGLARASFILSIVLSGVQNVVVRSAQEVPDWPSPEMGWVVTRSHNGAGDGPYQQIQLLWAVIRRSQREWNGRCGGCGQGQRGRLSINGLEGTPHDVRRCCRRSL